jgi:putative transposase
MRENDPEGRGSGNSRNGTTIKTMRGDFGEVDIETPRDRNSSFEAKIVAKRQTSVGNFSEAVISLYARGLTTREIEQHVQDIYGIEISLQFVSRVTEELHSRSQNGRAARSNVSTRSSLWTACAWPYAPKEAFKKCIYTVLGVTVAGKQEVLGLWIGRNRRRRGGDCGAPGAKALEPCSRRSG